MHSLTQILGINSYDTTIYFLDTFLNSIKNLHEFQFDDS